MHCSKLLCPPLLLDTYTYLQNSHLTQDTTKAEILVISAQFKSEEKASV